MNNASDQCLFTIIKGRELIIKSSLVYSVLFKPFSKNKVYFLKKVFNINNVFNKLYARKSLSLVSLITVFSEFSRILRAFKPLFSLGEVGGQWKYNLVSKNNLYNPNRIKNFYCGMIKSHTCFMCPVKMWIYKPGIEPTVFIIPKSNINALSLSEKNISSINHVHKFVMLSCNETRNLFTSGILWMAQL